MSRRIVFAGGSQTRALARIYRSEAAAQTGDDVVFIGTGAVGTDAARSTLLLADVLAIEVDEDGDAVPAADQPTRAELVRIPNLYADFLWPYAGRAHPKNRGAFALPGGPFPAEHGDRFLDQMVADGVDPDTAIARYLKLDIVTEGELDGRLTDRLAILKKLDEAGGYDLTDYVAENFRTTQLFRTRQRITMPLLQRLLTQLFPKLGVRGWRPESLRRVPFPAGAQPVHPGVVKHFGLTWAAPAQAYPLNEEGFFTFEAFCRRYMGFTWNETLQRGIQTAKTDPAAALADLQAGLAASPDSPLGKRALAAARRASGLDAANAGPDEVIDEDSYDPAEEAWPSAKEAEPTPAAAPEPPAVTPQPEPAAIVPAPEPEPAVTKPPAAEAAQAEPPPVPPVEPPPAPVVEPPKDVPPAPVKEPTPPPAPVITRAPTAQRTAAEKRKPEPPAAAPEPPPPHPVAPAKPHEMSAAKTGVEQGFTDFSRPSGGEVVETALATPGPESDLIDVLPRMLPVFNDLSSAVDRPYDLMPEVMPPPPLRPILPPELEEEPAKQGLLARILGRGK
jgi:hypothetical protein